MKRRRWIAVTTGETVEMMMKELENGELRPLDSKKNAKADAKYMIDDIDKDNKRVGLVAPKLKITGYIKVTYEYVEK